MGYSVTNGRCKKVRDNIKEIIEHLNRNVLAKDVAEKFDVNYNYMLRYLQKIKYEKDKQIFDYDFDIKEKNKDKIKEERKKSLWVGISPSKRGSKIKDNIEDIKARLDVGLSGRQVAKMFGVNYYNMWQYLRRIGYKRPQERYNRDYSIIEINKNKILDLLAVGASVYEIAKELNVKEKVLQQILGYN